MIKRPNNPFIKSTDIPDPFFCVIIPIKDPNISAGQLVALQALQLGKPIIATRCSGLKDYLVDGVTALVINNDIQDLHKCLEKLSDDAFYERMSRNEIEMFHAHYSSRSHGGFICRMCS